MDSNRLIMLLFTLILSSPKTKQMRAPHLINKFKNAKMGTPLTSYQVDLIVC